MELVEKHTCFGMYDADDPTCSGCILQDRCRTKLLERLRSTSLPDWEEIQVSFSVREAMPPLGGEITMGKQQGV